MYIRNDPILTITEDPRQFDDRSTVSIIAPNLSDSSVSTHLPPFKKPTIISYHINNSLDNNLISFITAYEKHCKDILISVTSHQVEEMNEIMGRFYENMPDNFRFLIRDIPEVTESVWRYDSLFFDVSIFYTFVAGLYVNKSQ